MCTMEDVNACLDAFKHLPYFKPLYTTILRQQMQFLTEQLHLHAGEESLVLTTNISAGTISSLTSTFGTGFLDHRSELKKQFTTHCSKNKETYDSLKYEKRRMGHSEQQNMAVKKKRMSELEKNHRTIKIPNMDDNLKLKDKDKCFQVNKFNKQTVKSNINSGSIKSHPDAPSTSIGDLTNIEIGNVRSLHSEESLATNSVVTHHKLSAETVKSEGDPDQNKTVIIKEEPDDVGSFMINMIKESEEGEKECLEAENVLTASEDSYAKESTIFHGQDSHFIQDDFKDPEKNWRTTDGQVAMETTNNVTDDMMSVRESYISDTDPVSVPEIKIVTETDDIKTVQKSYLSSSDDNSLPGKYSAETDSSEMWILAGVNSDANIVKTSNTTENDVSNFGKETSEELSFETGIDKCFEAAISQNFPTARSSRFLSNLNVPEYQKGIQYTSNMATPTSQVRRSVDESRPHYKCNYCPQSFTSLSSQKRHERRHTGETPFSCEFCDKRFYRKDDLHVHSLKHVGQKPYMCHICKIGYCKKKLLELHMAAHTESLESSSATSINE